MAENPDKCVSEPFLEHGASSPFVSRSSGWVAACSVSPAWRFRVRREPSVRQRWHPPMASRSAGGRRAWDEPRPGLGVGAADDVGADHLQSELEGIRHDARKVCPAAPEEHRSQQSSSVSSR